MKYAGSKNVAIENFFKKENEEKILEKVNKTFS